MGLLNFPLCKQLCRYICVLYSNPRPIPKLDNHLIYFSRGIFLKNQKEQDYFHELKK